ncbi:MAG: DUF6722 family protein [Nitrospirota bacterium]|jgi:hypothetical protein
MKHEERRKESGKMFIDIAKYIVTVGIIGNFLSEKMPLGAAIAIFTVAIISFIIGFYTIPPKKEGK